MRRHRRLSAPILLGLSLWAALPALEWCPFTWDACWAACEIEAETCASDDECRRPCAIPCDPEPDPLPIGDRAWCIHPPASGVPARGFEAPPPDPAPAEVIAAPRATAPAGIFQHRAEPDTPRIGPIAAHAPPRVRAPPV